MAHLSHVWEDCSAQWVQQQTKNSLQTALKTVGLLIGVYRSGIASLWFSDHFPKPSLKYSTIIFQT